MRDSWRQHDEGSSVYFRGAILKNLSSLPAQIEYGLTPPVAMKLNLVMLRQMPMQGKSQDVQAVHAYISSVDEQRTKMMHVASRLCRKYAN
jgi:hypothetical protein